MTWKNYLTDHEADELAALKSAKDQKATEYRNRWKRLKSRCDARMRRAKRRSPKIGPALQSYARHGSISYGPLTPERLRDLLLGAVPTNAELARLEQALMEMPGPYAFDLAKELGIRHSALNARALDLLGRELPQ